MQRVYRIYHNLLIQYSLKLSFMIQIDFVNDSYNGIGSRNPIEIKPQLNKPNSI